MQPSAGNKPPEREPGKSRLDREIEEILAKNDNIRHLPPTPKRRPRPASPRSGSRVPELAVPPRLQRILAIPLFLAVALGFLAFLLRDSSPLLANIASIAAISCLVVPMVQQFRGPSGSGRSETRMWRGQVVEMRPQPRSPLDGIRDWWNRRRR